MAMPEEQIEIERARTARDAEERSNSLDSRLRRTRQRIVRITKEAIFLLLTTAGIPLCLYIGYKGITKTYTGISKAYNHLASTKWEDRDTDIAGDAECDRILERTNGSVLLVYNCATREMDACSNPEQKPIRLHDGVSEISFENYESVTRPNSQDCEGGYKETVLEPK